VTLKETIVEEDPEWEVDTDRLLEPDILPLLETEMEGDSEDWMEAVEKRDIEERAEIEALGVRELMLRVILEV